MFIYDFLEYQEITFFYDLVYSERPNMNGFNMIHKAKIQDQLRKIRYYFKLELDIALPPNPENKLKYHEIL